MAKSTSRKAIYLGTFIHSRSLTELEYLHQTAVVVDDAGRIAATEKIGETDGKPIDTVSIRKGLCKKLEWDEDDINVVVAGENEFFFPGFIDTHIHAPQYPNNGLFGKTTLISWLYTYTFPMEASLTNLSKARAVYSAVISRTLSHGTTTASYFATNSVPATNLLADLCLQYGQRAFIGRVCMDTMSPDDYRDASAEASLQATKDSISHISQIDPEHSLVTPIITPRFAPSCTAPLLASLGKLAAETSLPVQTHISENHDEIRMVSEMFPESKHYTDVYDAAGLLTPRTVLAHGVHLSTEERAVIAARHCGVAHCPVSNSSVTSGTAKVRWLLEGGLKVGLGTDVSGGYAPSILEAARQALLVSRHVAMRESPGGESEAVGWGPERYRGLERAKLSIEECLYLATVGGAEVMGIQEQVGRFEVGMQWDAQLIGLGGNMQGIFQAETEGVEVVKDVVGSRSPVDIFGWETWEEKVAKWMFNGDDRNTKSVWVKGRLVHQQGQ